MSIKWIRKAEWGYKSGVHLADLGEGDWHFHIGKPDAWVLRGRGPNGEFVYRVFATLREAKADAAAIARDGVK